MNKQVKRSVMALMVAGMTFSGAAGVYAGTHLQKITAYLNSNISFNLNGTTFVPKDADGSKLLPVVYQDRTYLPVRALSEALNTPVYYDSKTGVITIGSSSGGPGSTPASPEAWVKIVYTAAQTEAISQAFAAFDGYEAAYAPQQMLKGDLFRNAVQTDDGVNLVFDNMTINVSPRDYSQGYTGTNVTLSNGLKGKWYTPGDRAMLTFKLDDRYVTVSSPDGKLSQAQLEQVGASVTKLGQPEAIGLTAVGYTASQIQAIKAEFAKFDGFTTAYAPMQMAKSDNYQSVSAGGDSVTFKFRHMSVQISPRDYSTGYEAKEVALAGGLKGKWYTPSDIPMLTFKIDDRYVTLSSPDKSLSSTLLEQAAAGVAKLK
ncbi:hypothetical protein AWM70_16040 [Paenibacillus yonginensis]|uniref:Copper amine oxidase-like N-terminal domain-containing protein n=1 Tax=Paenibacillus yonginensis TaxID=1462996 RepID=A0A1B1N3C6_9BACL|nr:stalk domain-containing protein [Paenibacillus yonginensis]ANS75909.1 hypothetical protein AWM70_16040 [Paenibacillus yonginensis]